MSLAAKEVQLTPPLSWLSRRQSSPSAGTATVPRVSTIFDMVLPAVAALWYARSLDPIAQIEMQVQQEQKRLHVPGVALAIFKGDKVIFQGVFGQRDVQANLPVTPRTIFSVASLTKSMTALLILQARDRGKLKLNDPPGKRLAYFRTTDPKAKPLTLSHLLSHTSGFRKTDLAWATRKLSRQELIQTVSGAKLQAPPGTHYAYQNVMYTALGDIAARAFRSSYGLVLKKNLFLPLHMANTGTTVASAMSHPDHARGYSPGGKPLEWHEDETLLGAGAVNSNLEDMSKYLAMLVAGGKKDVLSGRSFEEMTTKHAVVRGDLGYGYGWFVSNYKGRKMVRHGGNTDGFNSDLAFLPKEKIGYLLLTNVSDSPLGDEIASIVFDNLLPSGEMRKPATISSVGPAIATELLCGTYRAAGSEKVFRVYQEGGKLYLAGSDQPTVELIQKEGNLYNMAPPAPADFVAVFRREGAVVHASLHEGSAVYEVDMRVLKRANITAEAVMRRSVQANRDADLRHLQSLTLHYRRSYLNEGLTGEGLIRRTAAGDIEDKVQLFAMGKKIGFIEIAARTGKATVKASWTAPATLDTSTLANFLATENLTRDLEWKSMYSDVRLLGIDTIDGQDAYVVEKLPKGGTSITDYYSTQSFRLLRRQSSFGGDIYYRDYRETNGVFLARNVTTYSDQFGEIEDHIDRVEAK